VQNARHTQFQDFLSSVFTNIAKNTVSQPKKTWPLYRSWSGGGI